MHMNKEGPGKGFQTVGTSTPLITAVVLRKQAIAVILNKKPTYDSARCHGRWGSLAGSLWESHTWWHGPSHAQSPHLAPGKEQEESLNGLSKCSRPLSDHKHKSCPIPRSDPALGGLLNSHANAPHSSPWWGLSADALHSAVTCSSPLSTTEAHKLF